MTWLREFRFALRLMRGKPIVTLVTALSMGIGIGAVAVGFALFDGLLGNPLPALHAPEELVLIRAFDLKNPERLRPLSFADYLDYAQAVNRLAMLAASADCDLTLGGDRPAARISGSAVTASFFTTLGLAPAHGRLFTPDDETVPLAVLSYHFWRREFGSDLGVIGTAVTLNGKPFTVIGVTPPGFAGFDLVDRHDIWIPLGVYSSVVTGVMVPFSGRSDREQQWLDVIGRLASSATFKQANQAIGLVADNLAALYPEVNESRRARVLPLEEQIFGNDRRPRLEAFTLRFMATMALVLIAAIVNVASLLFARALARRKEIALRLSLGCSRYHLLRQLFVEGLCIALLGSIVGSGIAWVAIPLLNHLVLPVDLAGLSLTPSSRILAFAVAAGAVSAFIFALLPLTQTRRLDLVPALRGENPHGRRHLGARELIAVLQFAMALLVLLAAGLMLRTVVKLEAIPVGYDPSRVLVASVDVAAAGYEGPALATFYDGLLNRVRGLPGVRKVSMASAIPLMGSDLVVDLEVTPADTASTGSTDTAVSMRHALVGTDFFQTAGIELLRGRDFSSIDTMANSGVVILNESAARLLWPGGSPLGREVFLLQRESPFKVVGVVADALHASRKEERAPVIYLAHAQADKTFIGGLLAPGMSLLVRTDGAPSSLVPVLRRIVQETDESLPIYRIETLAGLLAKDTGVERQAALLYGAFAFIALVMAMLGLYGLLTQLVLEKAHDLGIRIALGARPGDLHRIVIRRSSLLAVIGILLGLAGSFVCVKLIESQLYGVEATDPTVWALAVSGMLATTFLVSLLPARRAAGITPHVALKRE